MNKYIQLSTAADTGTWYKVRILQGSWKATLTQPADYQRTLTGKGSKVFGTSYYTWQGVARVKASEDTGYATFSNLLDMMSSTSSTVNQVYLRTFYYGDGAWPVSDDVNKKYPCYFRSPFDPDYQVPYHVGAGAFYLVPIVLEQSGVAL